MNLQLLDLISGFGKLVETFYSLGNKEKLHFHYWYVFQFEKEEEFPSEKEEEEEGI